MRSDSLIVVTTGRGMVDALTSYVVDGQIKSTVMSERKEGNNGEKSQQREKSHKCNNCSDVMMENNYSVKNAITKVLQNIH